MANISQTAANVAVGASTTPTRIVQYGESVTQGMPLYLHTDGKYYQADANDTAAKAAVKAIALTPGASDAYGLVALPSSVAGTSTVNLGATLTIGETYAVSATKGAIAPLSDIGSGEYPAIIGQATTTALLDFQVAFAATAKA